MNFSPKIDENQLKQILGEIENDKMGGWVNLPMEFDDGELARIRLTAERIKEDSEVLVCIGIGGSYLGHRAVIEALQPKGGVEIVYAGNSLSQRELDLAMKKVGDRDFSVNVISKSGTTMEPARAFEAFKKKLAEKYGVMGAIRRIYVTTDGSKGTLHNEAERDNYTRFAIPNNLGGRYSVLSAVGLLPMAAAGVNISELLDGAAEFMESMNRIEKIEKTEKTEKTEELKTVEKIDEAKKAVEPEKTEVSEKTKAPESHTLPLKANGQPDLEGEEIDEEYIRKSPDEELPNDSKNEEKSTNNDEKEDAKQNDKQDAEQNNGQDVKDEKEYEEREILNTANPAFKYAYMRKLLFDKGYDTEVFATFEPATAYFNEWLKQLFAESEGKNRQGILPTSVVYSTDLHSLGQFMQDGRRNLFETIINYPTDELNAKIVEAVQTAHGKGGLPVLKIDIENYSAKGFGGLIYFFEMACAIYCKLVGVNPFDQPGVEAYKQELKRLIEKCDI